jgi:predicted kinase
LTRPALILTGGPATGKSVTGRLLAERRPTCAFIDVDDIRHLLVTGGAAPWKGAEGQRQQQLGVVNTCALARNFLAAGIEVIVADVLTAASAQLYADELPGCCVIHFAVSQPEAERRAAKRRRWLTDDEFRMLHDADRREPPAAHHHLHVDTLSVDGQIEAVKQLWSAHRG